MKPIREALPCPPGWENYNRIPYDISVDDLVDAMGYDVVDAVGGDTHFAILVNGRNYGWFEFGNLTVRLSMCRTYGDLEALRSAMVKEIKWFTNDHELAEWLINPPPAERWDLISDEDFHLLMSLLDRWDEEMSYTV